MTCDAHMNSQELLTMVCCYLIDHNYCGDFTVKLADLNEYRDLVMTSFIDPSVGMVTLKLRTPEGAQAEMDRLQKLKQVRGDT